MVGFATMVKPSKPHPVIFIYWTDSRSNRWWLSIENEHVGYWPGELFQKMKKSAQLVQWGGRVINTDPDLKHTATQMGSGHFPREGEFKAAWFEKLEYIDENGFFNPATLIDSKATRPECYDVKVKDWDKSAGATFLYGGPGYSDACQD
ncbi:hypothetical protein LINGRAHAP2_LOCUS12284 [Linum grandiflorum]